VSDSEPKLHCSEKGKSNPGIGIDRIEDRGNGHDVTQCAKLQEEGERTVMVEKTYR